MANYTDLILDSVDDGTIDRNELILKLLKFIGETEVKLFCHMNCIVERLDDEEK